MLLLIAGCSYGPFSSQIRSLPDSNALGADDPFFSAADPNQWYLRSLRAPEAWGLYAELRADPVSRGDTRTATLVVIDSWIDTSHPDLETVLARPLTEIVRVDGDQTNDVHGTHVSSLAAARSNDGYGIAGVGFNRDGWASTALWPVQVLEDRSGSVSDLIAGLNQIAEELASGRIMPPIVVNMSLGVSGSLGVNDSTVGGLAIENLERAGVLMIAAAGNGVSSIGVDGGVDWPASHPSVIAVGSVDFASDPASSTRSSFSDYGSDLELVAPGAFSSSGTPVGLVASIPGRAFGSLAGTSMASPLVAGVAATVWSANPRLSAVELRAILRESAVDLGPAGWDGETGYGLVDMEAALIAAASGAQGRFAVATTQDLDSRGSAASPLNVSMSSGDDILGHPVKMTGDGPAVSLLVMGAPESRISQIVREQALVAGVPIRDATVQGLGMIAANPVVGVRLSAPRARVQTFVEALVRHPEVVMAEWDKEISIDSLH